MPLEAIDHYTIHCTDLDGTRDFYRDVLGLSVGARPDLGFAGYWLYCKDIPVVHLLGPDGALPENRNAQPGSDTGSLDHIAFRGSNAQDMIRRLTQHAIPFRENEIRDFGLHQLFIRDPAGILVEMNFRG